MTAADSVVVWVIIGANIIFAMMLLAAVCTAGVTKVFGKLREKSRR